MPKLPVSQDSSINQNKKSWKIETVLVLVFSVLILHHNYIRHFEPQIRVMSNVLISDAVKVKDDDSKRPSKLAINYFWKFSASVYVWRIWCVFYKNKKRRCFIYNTIHAVVYTFLQYVLFAMIDFFLYFVTETKVCTLF